MVHSGAAVVDAMAGVDPGVTDTLAEVLAAGNTSGANNLIIDNGQAITTNTINETTAASGVTIDSVLLKDDGVNATNLEITNIKANDGTSAGSIADSTGVVTLASSVLTTADINGGTIDGTTLGATTPASVAATTGSFSSTLGVTGAATFSSTVAGAFNGTLGATTPASVAATTLSTTGDISLPDGAKAIFGAGSDLQIYHTGTDSRLVDSGTGTFYIAGTDIVFLDGTLAERYADFTFGGAAQLYYDNSAKLATTATGIDVTGTVTADGLTVDGDTQVNSASAAASGTRSIQFYRDSVERGAVRFDYSASAMELQADGSFFVSTGGEGTSLLIDGSTRDISFYEDTGTTAKFFWDSSTERLGIGTSSPSQTLETVGSIFINAPSGNPDITIKTAGTGNNPFVAYRAGDNIVFDNMLVASAATDYWRVGYGASGTITNEYLVVTSAGNVGIGTTSPKGKINSDVGNTTTVGAFSSSGLNITSTSGATNNIYQIGFGYASGATNAPASIYALTTSNAGFNNNAICFATRGVTTDTAPTERMRIDASGGIYGSSATGMTKFANYVPNYVAVADDGTITLTGATAGAMFIHVYDQGLGDGAVFFATYRGIAVLVTESASNTHPFETSDTDGAYCVIKTSNSHIVTFKNRTGATRQMGFLLSGANVS
jgi:hypothetical protein